MDKYTITLQVNARPKRIKSLAHQARLGTQLPKSAKSHLLLVLQAKYTIGPLINVLHHNVPKGKFITHNQSLANWFVNLVKNTIQPQIHAKTLRLHNVQPIHHGILVKTNVYVMLDMSKLVAHALCL